MLELIFDLVRKGSNGISFVVKEIQFGIVVFVYIEHCFGHALVTKKKQALIFASGFPQNYPGLPAQSPLRFVHFVFSSAAFGSFFPSSSNSFISDAVLLCDSFDRGNSCFV